MYKFYRSYLIFECESITPRGGETVNLPLQTCEKNKWTFFFVCHRPRLYLPQFVQSIIPYLQPSDDYRLHKPCKHGDLSPPVYRKLAQYNKHYQIFLHNPQPTCATQRFSCRKPFGRYHHKNQKVVFFNQKFRLSPF